MTPSPRRSGLSQTQYYLEGAICSPDGAEAHGKPVSWAFCGPYAAKNRPPDPEYAACGNGGTEAADSQACDPSTSGCGRRQCPGPRRRHSDRRPVRSRDGGCAASPAGGPLRASRSGDPSSYVLIRAEGPALRGQALPRGSGPTRRPIGLLPPGAVPADQIDLFDAARGDGPEVEGAPGPR